MNYGLSFNGKHSINDFGLIMEYKHILPPQKNKIKVSLPYMNGVYDFSTVATNGVDTFTQRQIDLKLDLVSSGKTKEELQILYSDVLEWLLDSGRQQIIFDDDLGYYWYGEFDNSQTASWEDTWYWGYLTLSFIVDPFKKGLTLEGLDNLYWDNINFLTDYFQQTGFNVTNTLTTTIQNVGRPVLPVITASTAMSVKINGADYNVVSGDNTIYGLTLKSGANNIVITGTGTISFNFRKERL